MGLRLDTGVPLMSMGAVEAEIKVMDCLVSVRTGRSWPLISHNEKKNRKLTEFGGALHQKHKYERVSH